MDSTARRMEPEIVSQQFAEIVRVDGRRAQVATPLRRFEATIASSCLVEPSVGDSVLIAAGEEKAYVLAVLERRRNSSTALVVDGDLSICAREGSVHVGAERGVTIASTSAVEIAGESLSLVSSADTRVVAAAISLLSNIADVEVDRIRTVARTVETMADRCIRRLKRAFSFIEETEQVQADRIELLATTSARIHGGTTVATAKDLIKVDGAQVHIG